MNIHDGHADRPALVLHGRKTSVQMSRYAAPLFISLPNLKKKKTRNSRFHSHALNNIQTYVCPLSLLNRKMYFPLTYFRFFFSDKEGDGKILGRKMFTFTTGPPSLSTSNAQSRDGKRGHGREHKHGSKVVASEKEEGSDGGKAKRVYY